MSLFGAIVSMANILKVLVEASHSESRASVTLETVHNETQDDLHKLLSDSRSGNSSLFEEVRLHKLLSDLSTEFGNGLNDDEFILLLG